MFIILRRRTLMLGHRILTLVFRNWDSHNVPNRDGAIWCVLLIRIRNCQENEACISIMSSCRKISTWQTDVAYLLFFENSLFSFIYFIIFYRCKSHTFVGIFLTEHHQSRKDGLSCLGLPSLFPHWYIALGHWDLKWVH